MDRLVYTQKRAKKKNKEDSTVKTKTSSKTARSLSPPHTNQPASPKHPDSPVGKNSRPHISSTIHSYPRAMPEHASLSSQTTANQPTPNLPKDSPELTPSSTHTKHIAETKLTPKGKGNTKSTAKLSATISDVASSKAVRENIARTRLRDASIPSQKKATSRSGKSSNQSKVNHSQERKSQKEYSSNDKNNTHSSIRKKSRPGNPYKDLPTHPLQNEAVEKHYALLTLSIIKSLFNKDCDCEKPNLLFFKVKSRSTVARCSNCHKQVSITSNTPLHKFQLPLGYFSYILHDAILQYPKVVTSAEISRKLNLPYKTAYLLKRRLQIVLSMLNTKLRESVREQLKSHVEANPIELPKGEDLRPILENYPVASADAVVLYSSSVKANKYRSRRFRTGSSSIYKSNNLGGEQVGTMVHTIGIKGSYTFFRSIPLTKQEYLIDDLDSVVPRELPLFTDEGYKFIWDRKNHRMVNHSKRSKDPRYNMSRERWVTKEGVSSNIAEGRNNILKQAFRSYYYVSPKWSQVYLDELSFLGNLRFEKDLARLLFTGSYSEEAVIEASYTSDSYYGDRDDDGSSRVSLDSFVGMSDEKCGRRDLNPHAFRRQNLNLVRLPISPRPHVVQCLKDGLFFNKKLFAKS